MFVLGGVLVLFVDDVCVCLIVVMDCVSVGGEGWDMELFCVIYVGCVIWVCMLGEVELE